MVRKIVLQGTINARKVHDWLACVLSAFAWNPLSIQQSFRCALAPVNSAPLAGLRQPSIRQSELQDNNVTKFGNWQD